ncbi:phospholipase D family protein [Luteimonas sp. JM171]|uniref:phospholipase D family protein n=1 Tax=Luteimonas sp. JM171 TaxID=1896164 RepID=UPI00085686C4|nr:phospholipase D family protein [Luteimonas sp. JM171]AOH36693.1 cardiolipin synthase [Luteimonas sp. JM171]
MKKRVKRILAWGLFTLLVMFVSGIVLADYLTPKATGEPSYALPVQPGQTLLDQELSPLLARHPGQTGVVMLVDGLDAFAARAISTRRAGRSIDLMYYIWQDDLTGHLLLRELWEAAERGVRVRLLLDDINTRGKDGALLAMVQHPYIDVRVYNPFRNRDGIRRLLEMVQRGWSINHRMHNKAWIADGRVAVVGGRNVGVEYFDAAEDMNFRDLDVALFGPAVDQASAIFDTFWNSDQVVPISALNRKPRERLDEVMAGILDETRSPQARRFLERVDASDNVTRYITRNLSPLWTDRIRVLSDPPDKRADQDRSGWLIHDILEDLRSARHKALLISPYFVPGSEGVVALANAVRNDAHVGVITNSLVANDVLAVHSGYAKYRKRLLLAGVQLYEMRADVRSETSLFGSSGASLHTKAYVVDDRRGFIGSFNMDPRSINLNTEMGVLFDDPALGQAVLDEYLLLSSPEWSYWLYLNEDRDLRWLDARTDPPTMETSEPGASLLQRSIAWVLGWLPIESQL